MAMTGQDVTIYRGQVATLTFTMTPVVDISGWDIRYTAARALGSSGKAIPMKQATVISGPLGMFRVTLTAAETDIRPAEYQHDAWRVDTGLETPLAFGTLTVQDIVRLPLAP